MHCLIKKIIFDTLRKLRDIIMRTFHLGNHIKLQLWIVQAKYRYFRGPFNVLFWFVVFFSIRPFCFLTYRSIHKIKVAQSCHFIDECWMVYHFFTEWLGFHLKIFFFKLMTSYKTLKFVFTYDHAGFSLSVSIYGYPP